MIFKITFKNPDCRVEVEGKPEIEYIDHLSEPLQELVGEFVEYGEYVTIAFDTIRGTATVLKQ